MSRFNHHLHHLLTNLAVATEEDLVWEMEMEEAVEMEEVVEMEAVEEMEEEMDVGVPEVPEAPEALEAPLVEWVEQVPLVQMAIVHGTGLVGVMEMVVEEEGEAGTEEEDLLDLTTTQPGMDPWVAEEVVDVVEEGVKAPVDLLVELVVWEVLEVLALMVIVPGTVLMAVMEVIMEDEARKMAAAGEGRRRGSRVVLPPDLGCSLLRFSQAIQSFRRLMCSLLVLLMMTSCQPLVWETGKVVEMEMGLAEEDKEGVAAMEESVQVAASKEATEVVEVEVDVAGTEEVAATDEEVEKVLLEELEGLVELVELVVWEVLVLMLIVPGTVLVAAMEARLEGVARKMVATRRARRRIGPESHKGRRLGVAGGRSPSG